MRVDEKDILNKIINENTELVSHISTEIKLLFNSAKLTDAFSSELRHIKYFIFEGQTLIFDNTDGYISIYHTEKIQHHHILLNIDIERIKNNKDAKIYLPYLLQINESYFKYQKTQKELKESLTLMVKNNEVTQEECDILLQNMKRIFDKEYNFSNNIHLIYLLIKFLKSESYLDLYSVDSLISHFISTSADYLEDKFFYLSSSIQNMIECATHEGLNSYQTSAEFNDCDNHFWLSPLNTVIMSEQTMMYCFSFKDLNNYDIYMINTEEYSKGLYKEYEENYKSITFREFLVLNLEQKIKENKIIDFEDKIFSLVDNKVTFINPLFFSYLFSSLKYFVAFLKEKYSLKENYPEDVYSYNYQKKYFKHKYNLDEFKFLCQSFLTLGGGFDYDEKKGSLFQSDIEYIHNMLEPEQKPNISVQQIPYLYPKKVSFLNKDWTQGLIYLVEQLELNKPDFLAHDFKYKTKEEAFKKSIAYLKKVIKKNS